MRQVPAPTLIPLHDASNWRGTRLNAGASLIAASLLALAGCGGGDSGSVASSTALASAGEHQLVRTVAPAPAPTPVPAPVAIPPGLTPIQALGQALFNDTNLSQPKGVACVSCHSPAQGFSDLNGSTLGVAKGSLPTSFGLRNPSQAAYSASIPAFAFVPAKAPATGVVPVGGQFWDGRADTLAAQALLPLLNPVEMNNASAAAVVNTVAQASYATLFKQVFGANVFANAGVAFNDIGLALQAFESGASFQAFSSKFDAVVSGKASFTAAEQRGLALFLDPNGGNCAGCHHVNPASSQPSDSPFTDNSYVVEGIPRNTLIPSNASATFYDLGLCGPERTPPTPPAGVNINHFCGAFRVPTLRNVALRGHYMHNGFFTQLSDVVSFYSTRNSNPQHWYGPTGIPNDLPAEYQGNLETKRAPFNRPASAGPLFTNAQISDLVTFLGTLSDGYLTPAN